MSSATISVPFSIATHWKKFTSTASLLNKTKAGAVGFVSGVPYMNAAGTAVPLSAGVTGTGFKMAAGQVALVTGTKAVATGLAGVLGFTATPMGQPTGTGTASHQILSPAFTGTTGAVTVTAYSVASVTGGTAAASTSTGTFSWVAIGT